MLLRRYQPTMIEKKSEETTKVAWVRERLAAEGYFITIKAIDNILAGNTPQIFTDDLIQRVRELSDEAYRS